VTHFIWSRLFFFAVAVGVSFALIYVETTTRLFFSFNAPRQIGDPCLTLIRPTKGPDVRTVWSNFGSCATTTRDPDREMIEVDLRNGLLVHSKTERLLSALPLPFTRVLRNRDTVSRAFGAGGTHTYDIALVGDAVRLSWVDLVLAGGGRVHYLPVPGQSWLDSDVAGYFGDTTLRWSGRDWRLHRDDGTELIFPESKNALRLEQAALLGMRTADGNDLLVIERDTAGNILSLSMRDRKLEFAHDTINRVTAIYSSVDGQLLRFEYDAAGCLTRQTGTGGEFQYDYDGREAGCNLTRTMHDGVDYFRADYSADDRVIRVTDPTGGTYVFSYETDGRGGVERMEVVDPESTLRRVALDDTGYWISRWGSYRAEPR
jgi:YD repeat-containing protein